MIIVFLFICRYKYVIHELISVLYYLRVFMCQMIMSMCTGVHRLCSKFSNLDIRKCYCYLVLTMYISGYA